MIGSLKGKIIQKKTNHLILETNGIGFSVGIPLSTYEKLSGDDVFLYIYTLMKENQLKLYGFYTIEEKDFFEELLKLNGIGPSIALAVLSGLSISEIIDAVEKSNINVFIRIPGIGKSKAEKILFELSRKKDKLRKTNKVNLPINIKNDAIEALVSLGFDEKKAISAVNSVFETKNDIKIEDLFLYIIVFIIITNQKLLL